MAEYEIPENAKPYGKLKQENAWLKERIRVLEDVVAALESANVAHSEWCQVKACNCGLSEFEEALSKARETKEPTK